MSSPIERVGFACVTYELGFSTNHTFRLKNRVGKKAVGAGERRTLLLI